MMNKLKIILPVLVCLVAVCYPFVVKASNNTDPTVTPVYDSECTKLVLLGSYTDTDGKTQSMYDSVTGYPLCNDTCQYNIIYGTNGARKTGAFCAYGHDDTLLTLKIQSSTADVENSALVWVRAGIYAVMGVSALLLVLYGLYGWYLRAMSEGQEEKIRESLKIYKNAIIGGLMVFAAVAITQLVFYIIGVTDSVFEFNFIPRVGSEVTVTKDDVGRYCYSTQTDTSGKYECVNNQWTAK